MPGKKQTKPENSKSSANDTSTGGPIVMRGQPKFGEVITPAQAEKALEEERNPQAAYWGTEDGSHP
jgi:hypothetical protein